MGLSVSILRNADNIGMFSADCTNNGVSARFTRLTLVNVDGPSIPSPDAPAAILRKGPMGSLNIVPSDDEGTPLPGWFMMGGNYAATSDSRFHEAIREMTGGKFTGAVAIHDRQE